MRFASSAEFLNHPQKAVTVLGMSGVGKSTMSQFLHDTQSWFTYSVDYRIGTHYMGEFIVDNFKREAMKVPLLRQLLRSDSIYISSNISFANLQPLSTYLGKPGNPEKGGIPFEEYCRRQQQHRKSEINALCDVPLFIEKAREIYGYEHFICDTGGSLCEVADPTDADDPVLKTLVESTVLIYLRGTADHARTLVERFRKSPKPMYYQPQFLADKWQQYKTLNAITNDNQVDPDDFTVWGFEELLHHRIPLYEAIAERYGYVIEMDQLSSLHTEGDIMELIACTIGQQQK